MVATEETTDRQHVLVVDDDVEIRDFLSRVVRRLGYEAVEAPSVTKALKVLNSQTVDLMLLDIYLKGATGLDLIKSLHRRRVSVPTVVVSGYISQPVAQQLVSFGVQGLVSKPFKRSRLEEEIANVISPCENFLATEDSGRPTEAEEQLDIGREQANEEGERRGAPRIPVRLPVKVGNGGPSPTFIQLVDISSTGMQTLGEDLITGPDPVPSCFNFQIPVVANLAWLHSTRVGNGFAMGWTFDDIIEQYVDAIARPCAEATKRNGLGGEGDNRREGKRIALNLPVLARGQKGKRLKMRLVNVSATGMQTFSEGIEVLRMRKSSPEERVVFDIRVEVRLAWMKPQGPDSYSFGWEFVLPDDYGSGSAYADQADSA